MNHMPQLNRRAFVVGTAAAGAGLALGFDVPFGGPTVVRAADGTTEVNAWVVIRPDDTVVINSSPKNSNATGTRSQRNIRRRAKAPRASARGAASIRAAASEFVPRSYMCAEAERLPA